MSQRKAKEYRRAMEQYQGVAADVDDLKRRIGAMEVRHRREDQMAEAARRRARAAAREQQEQERDEALKAVRPGLHGRPGPGRGVGRRYGLRGRRC